MCRLADVSLHALIYDNFTFIHGYTMRNEKKKLDTFSKIQIFANFIQKGSKFICKLPSKLKNILIKRLCKRLIKGSNLNSPIQSHLINPKLTNSDHFINFRFKPIQK